MAKSKVKTNILKVGRPTKYTLELVTNICNRIALGESLRKICKEEGMPYRQTVHDWLLDKNHQEFYDQYEKACNTRAENMFDELTDIADDGSNDYIEKERDDGSTYEVINSEHIQRSRLRVDTRKWYLSKIMPKKFGDKLDFGGEVKQKVINIIKYQDDDDTI